MTDVRSGDARARDMRAGIIYGETVYWGTIVAALLALTGSLITFVGDQNLMSPTYLLAALWEGQDVATVWGQTTGGIPDGHWYLNEIATGNGLTMAGIALGVFTVIPAILAAGNVLWRQKQRVSAAMAFVAAAVTTLAMSGALNFVFVR